MPITVLSRSVVELGIYPAVDPLESSSRILTEIVVGSNHYRVARKVQENLAEIQRIARYHIYPWHGGTQ